MININIENTVPDAIADLDIAELEKICRFVLEKESLHRRVSYLWSLSVMEDITVLQKDYFGIDSTTDVVSFDLSDEDCPEKSH